MGRRVYGMVAYGSVACRCERPPNFKLLPKLARIAGLSDDSIYLCTLPNSTIQLST